MLIFFLATIFTNGHAQIQTFPGQYGRGFLRSQSIGSEFSGIGPPESRRLTFRRIRRGSHQFAGGYTPQVCLKIIFIHPKNEILCEITHDLVCLHFGQLFVYFFQAVKNSLWRRWQIIQFLANRRFGPIQGTKYFSGQFSCWISTKLWYLHSFSRKKL